MPKNPTRASQGGAVDGTTRIDVTQGEACEVASASYDPGYDFGASLGYVSKADLKQGFCGYGKAVGEKGGDRD